MSQAYRRVKLFSATAFTMRIRFCDRHVSLRRHWSSGPRTRGDEPPYAIARQDGALLAFAGIWEGWRGPEGETLRSFAIVTTAANATMRRLHDRMPVILEARDWPAWLGEVDGDAGALLRPAVDDVLRLWPVSRAVNTVRNNGADLLDAVDDPHAPPPSDAPPGENPA